MPTVEPFIMDSLSLQLTGGPQGYRVNLKNMEIFGASNFTVKSMKWVLQKSVTKFIAKAICFTYFSLCLSLLLLFVAINLDWAKEIVHLKLVSLFHGLSFGPSIPVQVCYSLFRPVVRVILMPFLMVLWPSSRDKYPQKTRAKKHICTWTAWPWNWMWKKCACTSLKCSKIIAF